MDDRDANSKQHYCVSSSTVCDTAKKAELRGFADPLQRHVVSIGFTVLHNLVHRLLEHRTLLVGQDIRHGTTKVAPAIERNGLLFRQLEVRSLREARP